jgi:hypothetical protein
MNVEGDDRRNRCGAVISDLKSGADTHGALSVS